MNDISRTGRALACGVAAITALCVTSTEAAAQAPDKEFTIAIGETLTFSGKSVRSITVGLPDVASVKTTEGDRQVLVTGLAPGVTTLNFYASKGQKTFLVRVVPVNPVSLATEVREILGDRSGVDVRVVKGRVLLEGEVASETYKKRIEKMVDLYPAQVLNFTTYRESFVEGAKMVAVDLDFIQIAQTNRDQLGVRWGQFLGANFTFGSGDVLLDYQQQGAGGGGQVQGFGPGILPTDAQDPDRLPFSALLTSGSGLTSYLSLVGNLNMTLDLLTENGLVSTRQSGTIITEAGTEAEYKNGGTILIVVPAIAGGQGNVIEREYGLVFKVKPIVDIDDRVKLELDAQYVELDFANGVGELPALRDSSFKGTINMQEGQSVLITGFSGEVATDNERGFWLVSQVPIVGWLFKGRNFVSQGTDNALFVTPRIYEPGGKTHRALVRGVFENLLQAGAEPTDLPNLSNAPTAAKPKSNKSKPASSDFE